MGSIFGGSKQKSSSSSVNQAYPFIQSTYGPLAGITTKTGLDALNSLLKGDTSGFEAYKSATGYDPQAEAGSRGITANAAASGLLRSGSTGKRLMQFGNQLQQNFADSYFNKLLAQSNLGLGIGNLISGAGSTSTSSGSGSSSPGIGGFVGGLLASDRRLKQDITKLYERPDGLSVYSYKYVDGSGPFVGVMAEEVSSLRPEALGPVINGYATVDYSKLGDL